MAMMINLSSSPPPATNYNEDNVVYPSICNISSSSLFQMNYTTNFFDNSKVVVKPVVVPSITLSSSLSSSSTTSTATYSSFEVMENNNTLTNFLININNNYTVVIGKGKIPRTAEGNNNLKQLVRGKLHDYTTAKSKMIKSCIVTNIYDTIQLLCTNNTKRNQGSAAGFVRYDEKSGYVPAIEAVAREKITATFRDCLSDQYKSSSKNKVLKRKLANDIIKEKIKCTNKLQKTTTATTTSLRKKKTVTAKAKAATTMNKKNKNKDYKDSYTTNTGAAITAATPRFDFDVEFLGPFDINVFDNVPLPNLDCASTSSLSSFSNTSNSSLTNSNYSWKTIR